MKHHDYMMQPANGINQQQMAKYDTITKIQVCFSQCKCIQTTSISHFGRLNSQSLIFFWGWVRERAITVLGCGADYYTCITCKQTFLSNLLHEWFRQMKIKEQILANGKSYHATNEAKLLEFGLHGQIRNGLVFTAMFLMNETTTAKCNIIIKCTTK